MATLNQWERKVSAIIAEYKHDPESAHAAEDRLLWDFVFEQASSAGPNNPVARRLTRLARTDRDQWYA
jgi:hypothetical protein